MTLQLIAHHAPPCNAASAAGRLRGLAGIIGHGSCSGATPTVPQVPDLPAGRVTSAGQWSDATVHAALAQCLGPALAPALSETFDWYLCRGAFFHNDAHYDDVLFGVWCIGGPPADIVFPRAALRLDAGPGRLIVFDPFEIHGVLAPAETVYRGAAYEGSQPSVFVGFEVALSAATRTLFNVSPALEAPTLSSRTRIVAATGALA